MKLTIITVTRNNVLGLQATYESIRRQTEQTFEWIVIDGASTDGTKEFLHALPSGTTRFVSEPDRGIYDAMNKGITLATGDYLLFLNGGDELFEESTLRKIYDTLVSAGATAPGIAYGDCELLFEDGSRAYRRARQGSIDYGLWSYHQAVLYRRATIGNVRYPLDYRICSDYAFTAELVMNGATARHLDFPVCRFLCGGISDQSRWTLVREHRDIRRRVLRLSMARREWLGLLHGLSNFSRWLTPMVHRRVRFESSPSDHTRS